MFYSHGVVMSNENKILIISIHLDNYNLSFEEVRRVHCCTLLGLSDHVATDKNGKQIAYLFLGWPGKEYIPYEIMMVTDRIVSTDIDRGK
ncbi:hypothetical protein PanWU01x14_109510 [Parasponia andersonii]|uniref:Uncharacterized protein n=1 Tax=Parasponia andersonii TaxID=3476 RepID=A0A2P5CZQ1_PARAD|nr:hypothetical protein PanWU01x14_109510 [Parasponia andersonii]